MKKILFISLILIVVIFVLSSSNLNVNIHAESLLDRGISFGLNLDFHIPVNIFFLEFGFGVRAQRTDFNIFDLNSYDIYFVPDFAAGFRLNLGNLKFVAGLKYEPLITFSLSFITIHAHKAALEVGLYEPFRLSGKAGINLQENKLYFGLTVGFSIPLSFVNVPETTIRLQDYGIEPKALTSILLSSEATGQIIRCGESEPKTTIKVAGIEHFESLFRDDKKLKIYIGFSEDWNMEKNGFLELTLNSTDVSNLQVDGTNLKRIPEKVLKTTEQNVYILAYKINNLVVDDFKKPLQLQKSNLNLRIIPGKDVVLVSAKNKDGVDVLSKPIYADEYRAQEVKVKDRFANEFSIFGDFQLKLTKAGKNIDLGILEGLYEDTKQKINVRLTAEEIVPNYSKIGEFTAKFSRNQVLVDETFELNIALKDKYGNDITVSEKRNLKNEEEKSWQFDSHRFGKAFSTKQIGRGRSWSIEIVTKDNKTLPLKFSEDLTVLPDFKKVKISIDEKEIGKLELIANEAGTSTTNLRPLEISDDFGNKMEVRRITLSGSDVSLEIDLSNSKLKYNLKKAREMTEKDFNSKKVVLRIPRLNNIEQTVDSSELGSFKFNVPVIVKPNQPVKLVIDGMIDTIILPTYYDEKSRFKKEYSYYLEDKYRNKASESEIKFEIGSTVLEKILSFSSGKFIVDNQGATKPESFIVSVKNKNNTELQRIKIEIVPLLRVIKLDENGNGIESLGYNVYKIKLRAHDGNGNSYDGTHKIIINDFREIDVNFRNGIAELEFSSASYGIGSIKAIVEPKLPQIGHEEGQRNIRIMERFIGLGKINLSSINFERQINDERAKENAYSPLVSFTGNYVAYFVVKQDGTPGLIVNDLRNGKQEDVLTQVSSLKRRSGQSSSEMKQETVYSYTWIPMRDILIYTPMVSNSFDIYAYIPETKQKLELFKNGKNNTDITFDYTGKIATWVSGGVVMKANVDYSNNIRFMNPEELIKLNQVIIQPNISPNGKYVAFIAETDIYLFDIASRKQLRLTNDLNSEFELAWSPDSRYLAYYKKVGNRYGLYLTDLSEVENGKTSQERQIYKDIAYDFGKPVWISLDEVAFAANDVSSSSEAISVYEVSSNKVKRIKIIHDLGAAFTYLNILPVQNGGKYTLKAIYGGFTNREGVFLGQIK